MNVNTRSTVAPWRKGIEDEIERLIALLDTVDGDPDLEDNADDEPSLASPAQAVHGQILDDCEGDDSELDGNGHIAGGGYHA